MRAHPDAAQVQSGRQFMNSMGSGGRWAGERLLKALQEGRELSPKELRTNDTLPYNSWIEFDQVAIREGLMRAPLVGDLLAAGLVLPVTNAMGKTMYQWDVITDMEGAVVSLDGLARSDNDTVTFDQANVPLPITHKDFNLTLRRLQASRNGGEPLDTTQVGIAGRLVGEKIEYMLINGGPTFGSGTIYGLLNHTNRNTSAFGTNGNWLQVAKTGGNMYDDIQTGITALRADLFYGPYWAVLPAAYEGVIDDDYKAESDMTIRERIMKINGLQRIIVSDQMPANTIAIFQATKDVVALANGEPIQTIQWDIYGGMAIAFKVFAIQVPVIRATEAGRSGIFVMS